MWWKKEQLNKFQEIWLRVTNKPAFRKYQHELGISVYMEEFQAKISEFDLKHLNFYNRKLSTQSLHFKHSGNAGDIIYSLPLIRHLSKEHKAKLFLKINVPTGDPTYKHPVGNVRLSKKMFAMLKPLLESQSYIESCEIYSDQHIDYDLDVFRELPILPDRGHIARWYFLAFGQHGDLVNAWIQVKPDLQFNDKIVIARSMRYTNPAINYNFLNKYANLVFTGVEEEYLEMKKEIPHLTYQTVDNFLQLAEVIAGAKLFIGNQSFPYSLAEGLKVPRVLEVCPLYPNNIPEGDNGYDFLFQRQFESIVERF